MPGETTFQIKKWVSMINLNGDHEVTKEEFLNSIRCFYSLNQMSKFSSDYEKRNPKVPGEEEEESVEKILKELSIKIEDSGMKKKEAFDFIDFDKNGEITKEEMVEGLKGMGMHVGFVGRVVSVFDRDSSETVTLEEWCHLLGEDIELS
jgi:Ca2+-binding EF-hand superfamily protein